MTITIDLETAKEADIIGLLQMVKTRFHVPWRLLTQDRYTEGFNDGADKMATDPESFNEPV